MASAVPQTGDAGAGIDLHTHSTASDGSLAPHALVEAAAAAGVHLLALTDHDTVDGLDEAAQAARAHGLRLLPGVELSVRWQSHSLHLVGLGIDPDAGALRAGLERLRVLRAQRAEAIAAKLERIGVRDALARTQALAGDAQPTRTHFARLLVADGRCKDADRAFSQYLGSGGGAYVGTAWPELADAVGWICAAGGRAVIAHPMRYRLGTGTRMRLYREFREMGGSATEVCCGSGTEADRRRSAQEAQEYGLMGSVGSDYHGPEQAWLRLGRLPQLPRELTPVWQGLQGA